ncbi:hypothetical protein GOV12_04960 [Candidatus Pacearchaeota archaeon]|nr:hypothetical protein [Candidatus Pacearchaeota archaeon]
MHNNLATGNKVCELAGYSQKIRSWGNSYNTPENNYVIQWHEDSGQFITKSAKGRNNKLIGLTCAAECFIPPACSDGIDNDLDGLVDLDDPGCYNENDDSEEEHDIDCEEEEVCNLLDDNHNGEVDENNGDCLDSQICTEGECVDIVCSQNSDCGVDDFFGDSFCAENNVNRNFLTNICIFPKTSVSFCSQETIIKELEQCGDKTCGDGECVDGGEECVDNDNDSYDTCDNDTPKDCNDNDSNVNPGAMEVCDGIDNDCDGRTDEGCGGDSLPPAVDLISPLNDSIFFNRQDIEFLFNVVEENEILECGVNVSDIEFIITEDISKDSINSKIINIGTGNYTAFVFCIDDSNNIGESQVIDFEIKDEGDCDNDNEAPSKITNLEVDKKSDDYIKWEWDNPSDLDFSKNIIFIDGEKVLETSNNYYKADDLEEDTRYKITIHTKDLCGNINDTNVSDTEKTKDDSRGGYFERDIYPEDIIFQDVSLIGRAIEKTQEEIKITIKTDDEILVDQYCNWLFWVLVIIFIILLILLVVFIVRSVA